MRSLDGASLRGLSLTQPWATLLALGVKKVESRSWVTNYRGHVAIHASKGFPLEAKEVCGLEPFEGALLRAGYSGQVKRGYDLRGATSNLPLGQVIAVGTLEGCFLTTTIRPGSLVDSLLTDQERAFGDYSPGRWAWVFSDIVRLPEPIPWKGTLGLWTVPPELRAQIEAQLGRGGHGA